MGMFSRKKTLYVSSTAYNLAGDEENRFDFLKTNMFGAIISNQPIAETITKAYLTGPGIKLRSFARWAQNSDLLLHTGTVSGRLFEANSIDKDVLADEIAHSGSETVVVYNSEISPADYSYWADQYVADNHPERLDTDYLTDQVTGTGEITIQYEDLSIESFMPVNFDKSAAYLYAVYSLATGSVPGSVISGTEVAIPDLDPYPSTTGFTNTLSTTDTIPVSLDEVTEVDITYSDATPPEYSSTTVTTSDSYVEFHEVWEKTEPAPPVPAVDEVATLTTYLYLDRIGTIEQEVTIDTVVEDIGGGVFKTTVTTVTTDVIVIKKSHRTDTKKDIEKSYSSRKVFIYKYQDGNPTLDAMFAPSVGQGIFFPPIPFILDGADVKSAYPVAYEIFKKGYKKATGGKYDKTRQNIYNNPSIGDIDYAYVVFGVSLNVKENSCKKYVYKFFQRMMDQSSDGTSAYLDFKIKWALAKDSWQEWIQWREDFAAGLVPATSEPVRLPYPTMPQQGIGISSDGNPNFNYNISIYWNSIIEDFGPGLCFPDIKPGELRFVIGTTDEFEELTWGDRPDGTLGALLGQAKYSNFVTLYWQTSDNTWTSLIIAGLTHGNYVYGGKWVATTALEALSDYEESGFIVPLHEDIYKSLSIKDYTQMSTACCFLLFNCYKEVKQKWYQTTLFKVILIVASIVISIFNPPAGVAVAAAALGVTVATYIVINAIITAIVNMLIAMIISRILTAAATAVFGEKVGRIVGSVATVVVMIYGGSIASSGSSFTTSAAAMASAPNLLMLTQVTANAYSQYISACTAQTLGDMQSFTKDTESKLKDLQNKYVDQFGLGILGFNPMELIDSADVFFESSEDFLSRTLMTGSDIVDMSLDMIYNYVDISINRDLPLTS